MAQFPPHSRRYLSDVLTATGITTVKELADRLECTRATLHEQLRGEREMSATQAVRVALLLRESHLRVIAATQYHQARRAQDKRLWLALWRESAPPLD